MAITIDIIYAIFVIINFGCVCWFHDAVIKELKTNKLTDENDITYKFIRTNHIRQFYKYTIATNIIFIAILFVMRTGLLTAEIDQNTNKTILVWIFLYIWLSLLFSSVYIYLITRSSIDVNNSDITDEMIELELKKRYAVLALCFLPMFLIGILLGTLQLFNGVGVHIIFK